MGLVPPEPTPELLGVTDICLEGSAMPIVFCSFEEDKTVAACSSENEFNWTPSIVWYGLSTALKERLGVYRRQITEYVSGCVGFWALSPRGGDSLLASPAHPTRAGPEGEPLTIDVSPSDNSSDYLSSFLFHCAQRSQAPVFRQFPGCRQLADLLFTRISVPSSVRNPLHIHYHSK